MGASAQQVKGQWEGKGKLPTPAEARRAPTGPFGVPGHARHGSRGGGWGGDKGAEAAGRERGVGKERRRLWGLASTGCGDAGGDPRARGKRGVGRARAGARGQTRGRGSEGAQRGLGTGRGGRGPEAARGSPWTPALGCGSAARAPTPRPARPSSFMPARPRGRRGRRLRGRLGKPRAREDRTGQDGTGRGWGGAPTSEESAGAGDDVTAPAGGATGRDEGRRGPRGAGVWQGGAELGVGGRGLKVT